MKLSILKTVTVTSQVLRTVTLPSTSPPSTTPHIELVKRAEACGDLQGNYPNAAAPTCAGAQSICTFSAGYQGCCDENDNCAFYTSCQGGLVPSSSRCSNNACLQCPGAAPYCTQYKFSEGVSAYEGFACGTIYIGDVSVQGIVGSQMVAAESTSSTESASASSESSTSSAASNSASSSASSSTPTDTSSGTTTIDPSAAVASATNGAQAGDSTGDGTKVGAIAGGVVGGVVLAALIIGACFWKRYRDKKHRGQYHQPMQ